VKLLRATSAIGAGFGLAAALAAVFALAAPTPAQDKDTFTPMPLDERFGPIDTRPPSTPPDEIIKQFSAKETEFEEALGHYTYRRTARIDTIDDFKHAVNGEWYEEDDVIFTPDGRRTEKTVYSPASTLRGVVLSPSDLQDIEGGYSYVLTTAEVPAYNIGYVGRQKVDEVYCYVFDVSPKQILKNHRYLLGRIWVDDHDPQILITSGSMVPDDTRRGHQDLHPPFMTWRDQIDDHYWFPVYTKSEGILHFAGSKGRLGQDVHIREVVKYSAFKLSGRTAKTIDSGQDVQNQSQPAPPQQK
jgi:hypothetical protein